MQYFEARAMPKPDEKFSDQETKNRFEAALRGARVAGHRPMESLSPNKAKKQQKPKKTTKKP
jgi:hypothetical protein